MALIDSLLPAHPQLRRKLGPGFAVLLGVGLLSYVPVSMGPFGAPWPLALVWAAAGWSRSGALVVPALLIGLAGLWLDGVTGGPTGAWAFVGLAAYGLTLVQHATIGQLPVRELQGAATAGYALMAGVVLTLLRGDLSGILALVLPCLGAALLFALAEPLYSLDEERDTR
jgi:hypothetical protein